MRRRLFVLGVVFSIIFWGGEMFHGKLLSSSDLSIPITAWELAGLRSKDTPLFCGIPFPEGRLMASQGLAVVSSTGKVIPSQMNVMSRWPKDGSIRWLGVNFIAGVEPLKPTKYRLELIKDQKQPSPIYAAYIDNRWVIDTGTLRFYINPKRFNVLDGVWLDPGGLGQYPKDSVVPPGHNQGLLLHVNGRRLESVDSSPVKVKLEEAGPIKVTLCVEGHFRQGDYDSNFGYIMRITAYKGQRFINIDYTLTNYAAEQFSRVQAASFSLPMDDRQRQAEAIFGQENAPVKETLMDKEVWLAQRSESVLESYGITKPITSPSNWCDRQTGRYGMGVALQWFSEMHPKRWVADGSGLRMELVPGDGEPLLWPSGVARTHTMIWAFHPVNDMATVKLIAGLTRRSPVVMADSDWVCTSGALGKIPASRRLNGNGTLTALGEAYDRRFADDFKRILAQGLAGRTTKDQGATGLFDFGDLPFISQPNEKVAERKEDIYWSNHLYDLPHVLWLQYARTADPALAEVAKIFSLHMGEVDIAHPRGAARVSPARLHVRDYRTRQVGAAEDLSFLKNKGLLWCYYFTGNLRAKDLAIVEADYALSVEELDFNEPKTLGSGVSTLLTGYELTNDHRYLDRAEHLLLRSLAWQKMHKGGLPADFTYQMGLALESYGEFLQWRQSEDVTDGLRQAVDYAIFHYWSPKTARIQDDGGLALSGPLGLAFDLTGNIRYRDIAVAQLESWIKTPTTIRNARDFALVYHNIPFLLGRLESQTAHE